MQPRYRIITFFITLCLTTLAAAQSSPTASPALHAPDAFDLVADARTGLHLDMDSDAVARAAQGDAFDLQFAYDDHTRDRADDRIERDPGQTMRDVHNHFDSKRVDSHAPIGVMGDHLHAAGEIMLSYRFMYMEMDGNRVGDSGVSDQDVRNRGFMVVPTDMTMEMHMLGVMYAPTDEVTLMLMIPYIRMAMNHKAGMPLGAVEFKTVSEGLGDVKLSGLIKVFADDHNHLHANVGISFPTGKINKKDRTPMGRVILPYPMQLGSGTPDLTIGGTFVHQREMWSLGAQALGTIRLGRNYRDYSKGDRFEATAWFQYQFIEMLSGSVRLKYNLWGNYDGADPSLNPMLVPTADPDRRGGQSVDLLLGLNLYIKDGPLKGHRFAIEGGLPVWQKLSGPQLETDWMVIVGWQYAF